MIFPKTSRLLSRGQFERVTKRGKRIVGRFFCVDALASDQPRLGISASGRYGNALERNRFKRLVREAFRKSKGTLPCVDLHVVPRQLAKKASFADISKEMDALLLPQSQ